ncbi:MAG: BMP family lipoprotein [Cellulomonadaceae bacterium]
MKTTVKVAALGAAAALALTACGDAPSDEPTTPTGSDTAETTDAPPAESIDFKGCMVSDFGGFDDNSFNESGFNGLERAKSELGIETATAESTDAGQYAGNLDSMVQASCDLIITVGFNLADATAAAADADADQHFALIDSAVDPARDNVKPLLFNTQEAAFLAGYLAAGVTETGTVATYGGQPYPSVTIFMDGFVDGVAKYNEDNDADVTVLGWDKESQNGSFSETFEDIGVGTSLTDGFIAQGADIILPVAGPVGEGSLAAASQHEGVKVIWVDSDGFLQANLDQYKGLILTSVMKEIGQSVFDVVEATADGSFSAEPYVGTLENGGVGLAPYHDLEADVPAELQAQIDALKEQIISGEVVVESPSATPVD